MVLILHNLSVRGVYAKRDVLAHDRYKNAYKKSRRREGGNFETLDVILKAEM